MPRRASAARLVRNLDSPAVAAGLKPNDILLADFDGLNTFHTCPYVVGVAAVRGVLLQSGFADDHRAVLAQPRDLERVVGRTESVEGHAAIRRHHVERVAEIFHHDRDSQQRPGRALLAGGVCALACSSASAATNSYAWNPNWPLS